jgi:general stress protein CsbA
MAYVKEHINQRLSDLLKEILKNKRLMITQMVFAILLYMVLIANQLTNQYDGLWSGSYELAGKWELSIGRWFWLYIDRLRLGISAEPTTSILTIFLVCIGNLLIINAFDMIESKISYLVCFLILSSTTICNWLSYRYMSPTFGCSYLFSVLAAWILIKKVSGRNKKEWIWCAVSAMMLTLCLGSYQANLACTCVMILLYFFKAILLADKDEYKKIIYHIVLSVVALMGGCIIYKIIWDIHCKIKNVTPSSYNGADSLSIKNMILSIPQGIQRTYTAFYNYFFKPWIKHNLFQQYGIYYVIFAVFMVALFSVMLYSKKIKKNLPLLLITLVLLPMACNASLFLATESGIMIQMTGGMMILFPCILCLLDSVSYFNKLGGLIQKKLLVLSIIASVIILYGNIYMVTTDVDAMYEGKNATETMVDHVIIQLQNRNEYDLNKSYIFIGRPSDNETFQTTQIWNNANAYARYGQFYMGADTVRMAYKGVLRNLGINLPYGTDESYRNLIESEEIRNMPTYPNEGYIQEIDGCVVIKISNTY